MATRGQAGSENEEGAEDNLVSVSRTIAVFLKADPLVFNGTINPAEADNWFKTVEGALQTQQVSSNQFVEYAAYQLVGEAQQWWQGEC
ncbi:hypothetical protein AHAS_Ahas12G0096100 [Arachis hypogaea]